jgi:hypothetical protein
LFAVREVRAIADEVSAIGDEVCVIAAEVSAIGGGFPAKSGQVRGTDEEVSGIDVEVSGIDEEVAGMKEERRSAAAEVRAAREGVLSLASEGRGLADGPPASARAARGGGSPGGPSRARYRRPEPEPFAEPRRIGDPGRRIAPPRDRVEGATAGA